VYVPDLGIDKVMIYGLDAPASLLQPAEVPWAAVKPGSGPRHIAIHPKGNYAYLAEELGNTTAVFKRDKISGGLTEIQRISSLPDDFSGSNTNADIHTDPDGEYLYVSNRGHNSLVIYRIDPSTGLLTTVGYEPVRGDHPRNFMIDGTGKLLLVANRGTNNVVVFNMDKGTGKLKYSGVEISVPAPVCVKMLKLK
jgi:6-phosphogluconolactonase